MFHCTVSITKQNYISSQISVCTVLRSENQLHFTQQLMPGFNYCPIHMSAVYCKYRLPADLQPVRPRCIAGQLFHYCNTFIANT